MPIQTTSIPAEAPAIAEVFPRSRRGALTKIWIVELPSIVLLAALLVVRLNGTVEPDVAWQLWIAGRLHDGARLYRDIVEINPPLWFWMAVPIDRLAHLLRYRPDAVMIAAMAIASMASVVATGRLCSISMLAGAH